jgi:hypothetical protein
MNITTQLAVTEIHKYVFYKNIIQTKLIVIFINVYNAMFTIFNDSNGSPPYYFIDLHLHRFTLTRAKRAQFVLRLAMGWMADESWFGFPEGTRDFRHIHSVIIGFGPAHPPSQCIGVFLVNSK